MATRRMTTTGPITLAIDIGGTGLKASVLDAQGTMVTDRVRVETTYPLPPTEMVDRLATLVAGLPASDRVSIGFPGVVRHGLVLTAPHFITKSGPGSKIVPELVAAWDRFDLVAAMVDKLGKPVRLINDADLQGLEVFTGVGMEVMVTLGTGVGTAIAQNGRLGPHLEFAHHRFRGGATYDEYLGNDALEEIGKKRWNGRVDKMLASMRSLFVFDHLYIGGGNSKKITFDLPDGVTLVDPNAGLLGGLELWGLAEAP